MTIDRQLSGRTEEDDSFVYPTARHFRLLAPALLPLFLFSHPAHAEDAAWYERIEPSGDFRLRYETISEEQSANRERGRFRARAGFTAPLAGDIKVILRLATGDGSPVSTNVTFGDGFSGKDIVVDRAYADWHINEAWHLYGGKMKSPWIRSGGNALLWDGDLNPEGVAAAYDAGRYFARFAVLSASERSGTDDSLLFSAQGGVDVPFRDAGTLRAGAGIHRYTDTVGNQPFYDGSADGNSVDASGNYLFDYSLVELFGEYKTAMGDWPLIVFGEWVRNTEVSAEDTAYVIGAKIGAAKAPGDMQLGYSWQSTEADAVIATFNDSDFAGGNTDATGHYLKGSYAVRENISLGATLIIARRGEFAGNERDYDRFMLDIAFSFE